MNKSIIVTGPTASGKSDIAIKIAKKLNGEIVSADSMQIYRKMDIVTAKPDLFQLNEVRHHMIDIIDIEDNYSVARYKDEAIKCIKDILSRSKVPIITGGTGLYIDSLLYGISFNNEYPENKNRFELYLKENGKEELFKLLLERDEQAALTTHPNNTKRVIRYLDILSRFKGTLSEYKQQAIKNDSGIDFNVFVLNPSRDKLYERIESRVDIMIEKGLIEEVLSILKSQIDSNCTSMQAIGYKEVVKYLDGYCTYDEMIRILKMNTRNYAKRQITWFKRYKEAQFIDTSKFENSNEITRFIISCL